MWKNKARNLCAAAHAPHCLDGAKGKGLQIQIPDKSYFKLYSCKKNMLDMVTALADSNNCFVNVETGVY